MDFYYVKQIVTRFLIFFYKYRMFAFCNIKSIDYHAKI